MTGLIVAVLVVCGPFLSGAHDAFGGPPSGGAPTLTDVKTGTHLYLKEIGTACRSGNVCRVKIPALCAGLPMLVTSAGRPVRPAVATATVLTVDIRREGSVASGAQHVSQGRILEFPFPYRGRNVVIVSVIRKQTITRYAGCAGT